MIEALIFDLDGTLVQTEKLKAMSYAQAAVELCPYSINEDQVIESFKEVVGRSRREVARHLVDRFELSERAMARAQEFGLDNPWQIFVQVRLGYYQQMLANPEVIRSNQWPYNIALLREAAQAQCKVALATMSHREQVQRILTVLDLLQAFDFVATRDDVEKGKPDPEIYHLVASELGIEPDRCLVIEDSTSGVRAALAAGMGVVAVATPFTRQSLHESHLLRPSYIVDNPAEVSLIVSGLLNQARSEDGRVRHSKLQ